MGFGTNLLVAAALVTAVAVAVQMARHPILLRMATRNALRRPRQTATVIAGLMVGTAIISSALVAGDSAGASIRGAVFQALGPIDETVELEGYSFFPQIVLEDLQTDPNISGWFDGISGNVIWPVAAVNGRTDLFEPRAILAGFDPADDAAFGDFELVGAPPWDAIDLGPDEVILTQRLAAELDAQVGDPIELRFTTPLDPAIPTIIPLNGTLVASTSTTPADPPGSPIPLPVPVADPLGPDPDNDPTVDWIAIDVAPNATRITALVGWPVDRNGPGVRTEEVGLQLVAPNGTRVVSDSRPLAEVSGLSWLNWTANQLETLPAGSWHLGISASQGVALNVPYAGVAVVLHPAYTLRDLLETQPGGATGSPEPDDQLPEWIEGLLTPQTASFTVAGITDGGRGDQFDFGDAVFARMDTAQQILGRPDQINILKLSNPGSVTEGVARTDEALILLDEAIQEIRAQYNHPALDALQIQSMKADFLAVADSAGELLTSLLLFAGSLSIMSGLLLIVNIFTMLAEERRSELGMSRAIGLSRKDLVRLFSFEGGLYAVAAAAIGALLGLGLAWGMVVGINWIIGRVATDSRFPAIEYVPTLQAYLAAFAAGTLLTYVTVVAASRRASRINIVRAIRRIDEPERNAPRWVVRAGIPLALLGLAGATAGWVANQFSLQVFGALVAVAGGSMALSRMVTKTRLYPAAAAALVVYYVASYFLISEYSNIEETNIVGPIRGVLLTMSVVVLVVHFDWGTRRVGKLLSLSKSLRPVAVPALAYPLHRRFRTGMTLSIFSIVILAIGFFSIFGALFETDVERQTGGFDIAATTTLDVDSLGEFDRGLVSDGLLASTVQVDRYRTLWPQFITVNGEQTGHFGPPQHQVYGIDDEFVAAQNMRLLWRNEIFTSDAQAYDAAIRGDGVVVAYQYSTDDRNQDLSFEVGDTLEVHVGDATRDFPILGIQEQWHFPGIFLGKPIVEQLVPRTSALFLYQVHEGQVAGDVAKLLEQNYRDAGMDADDIAAEVAEEQEAFSQVMGAMKLFLGLGLVVGVLSLGIVTSRSVLERRQEIGMLRALGFTRGQIGRVFLIEVLATVVIGSVVGIACSIVVTYGIWFAVIRELHYPYVIPWLEIVLLLAASGFVAVLATVAPMARATRVAPAEALRYVD